MSWIEPLPEINRELSTEERLDKLEETLNRVDHNLIVLLDTVSAVVNSFESNPMAKMFMKKMKS